MIDGTKAISEWEQAGQAWGAPPCDWAYLGESLGRPSYDAVLTATSVGKGTRVLDIGCGAGKLGEALPPKPKGVVSVVKAIYPKKRRPTQTRKTKR